MRFLFMVLTLALTAGLASAQECSIGVYADEAGTEMVYQPTQGQPFDIYVIMRVEDVAKGVALDLFIPGLNVELFEQGTFYGPTGAGLNINTSGGDNVGLGECAVGFGGQNILVIKKTLFFPFETIGSRTVVVGPNEDVDSNAVIYVTCNNVLTPCNVSNPLLIGSPIATESKSWGAVKSLF